MNHTYEICLALGVVVPLVSFFIIAVWGAAIGKPKASYIALAAIGTCALLGVYVLLGWLNADDAMRKTLADNAFRYDWAVLGASTPITVGVKLDSLTVIMYFMVTFIAFWIHFFSIGYMEGHSDVVDGESKYHRFFAYLSLFCFSMLGLVVSSSLLFMFFFWELVGLCSYLLIGFYFDKKFASDAGMKAFIVNRVGDFGFVIGLMLVILYLGTFDLDGAAREFSTQAHSGSGIFASSINLFGWQVSGTMLATLMGICLFCGAMGKSAQFPLHVWLPNAYAYAPSMATAFLAATATKVAVYLLLRYFFPVFGASIIFTRLPVAEIFLVLSLAAMFGASIVAVFQDNVKRMLAYSSVAQIGYITLGIAIENKTGLTGGIVHLFNHALIKGALFMAIGAVYYQIGSVKLDDLAGLGKRMPITMGAFVIAGFSIIGVPGTVGFVSKWYLGLGAFEEGWWWLVFLLVASSLISVVYIGRIVEVVWFRPVSAAAKRAEEPPLSMLLPTLLLTAATVYFGLDTSLTAGIAERAAEWLLAGVR